MKIKEIEVKLSSRSYPIFIGRGLSEIIESELSLRKSEGKKLSFISEENIWKKFVKAPSVNADVEIVLENGEGAKSFKNLEKICDNLALAKIDRTSAIFAFGGGVVGDISGFAASIYMRGIDFYQVPTTLLAAVDSSVGGKTAINIKAGKNLVGAFHQPRAVFIDTAYLDSLPEREFSAGMAEVIKYGMLGDIKFFEKLEQLETPLNSKHTELTDVIAHACKMKADVVSEDERETNKNSGRVFLNLGHTFAHAIENVAGYGKYLHGEAVGLGLLLAARMSVKLGTLSVAELSRVEALLKVYKLPVKFTEALDIDALVSALLLDKKNEAGMLRFVLLKGLGSCVVRKDITLNLVKEIFSTAL